MFIWLNHIANMLLFSTASITYKIDETEGLLFIGFLHFCNVANVVKQHNWGKNFFPVIKLIGIHVYRHTQEILAFPSWF